MHSWSRPQEPDELRTQCAALTQDFMDKRQATGLTPGCTWPKVQNAAGEVMTLQELLSIHTCQHCSYCDGRMGYTSRDTIDHFLPKKHFPLLAYAWANLYLCCDGCQRKGTDYDEQALRPDEADYSFSRYFRYDLDGQIKIVANDTADRQRAEITLRVLRLNHDKLVKDRSQAFRRYSIPRRRPLRPGLDCRTAALMFEHQTLSFEDKPYRDFFVQDRQD